MREKERLRGRRKERGSFLHTRQSHTFLIANVII